MLPPETTQTTFPGPARPDSAAAGAIAPAPSAITRTRSASVRTAAAASATGAYCRSAASNYNHVPRPAVAAVRDGAARLLVRRETIDDLLRLDAG